MALKTHGCVCTSRYTDNIGMIVFQSLLLEVFNFKLSINEGGKTTVKGCAIEFS